MKSFNYRVVPIEPLTRFNYLVTTGAWKHVAGSDYIWWECLCCLCNRTTWVRSNSLRRGVMTSCGCLRSARIEREGQMKRRHGHSVMMVNGKPTLTPTYRTWISMKKRCLDPNDAGYRRRYGGHGITICSRWIVFDNFLTDMGERPQGTTIDRIDGKKGYEPENCRWATPEVQANNRWCSRFLTYRDQRMTIAQWARKLGISPTTLQNRLDRGWSVDVVLSLGKLSPKGSIGSANGNSRLSTDQVIQIRTRYVPHKVSAKQLAREFGVDKHTILRIVRGESWKHITIPERDA